MLLLAAGLGSDFMVIGKESWGFFGGNIMGVGDTLGDLINGKYRILKVYNGIN
jgi:hypothetical protein